MSSKSSHRDVMLATYRNSSIVHQAINTAQNVGIDATKLQNRPNGVTSNEVLRNTNITMSFLTR